MSKKTTKPQTKSVEKNLQKRRGSKKTVAKTEKNNKIQNCYKRFLNFDPKKTKVAQSTGRQHKG